MYHLAALLAHLDGLVLHLGGLRRLERLHCFTLVKLFHAVTTIENLRLVLHGPLERPSLQKALQVLVYDVVELDAPLLYLLVIHGLRQAELQRLTARLLIVIIFVLKVRFALRHEHLVDEDPELVDEQFSECDVGELVLFELGQVLLHEADELLVFVHLLVELIYLILVYYLFCGEVELEIVVTLFKVAYDSLNRLLQDVFA